MAMSCCTHASPSTGERARVSPPAPEGYTGNVVLWARPTATARGLVTGPLHHTVELINREVARIDGGYFKSIVHRLRQLRCGGEGAARLVAWADPGDGAQAEHRGGQLAADPDIPFHGLDLGSGQPLFLMPSFLIL
uniref:Uncharacterized protein n=1 Tax=Oryza brachyantha TaxID=4533 RepID=J3M2D6_ORYBR